MARGRYYLDTSAYLCVLLGEAGWQRLAGEIDGGEVVSSVLLVLESERTLVQLSRAGRLGADELQNALDRLSTDVEKLALRDLTFDLCGSRVMPLVSTPRSLDLAHLRTALWFDRQQSLTRFVSLDAAQNQAARELGLPV
ncbi:MAG: hypothetical protein HYR51_18825 [Candidatus Rokubacteria bacterium]|nr:hypothetical protein [Candidatus Rokubacteria bacterium]